MQVSVSLSTDDIEDIILVLRDYVRSTASKEYKEVLLSIIATLVAQSIRNTTTANERSREVRTTKTDS